MMKLKQPRASPTHVTGKDSPPMRTGTSQAIPLHGKRSSFATVTRRLLPPRGTSPRRRMMKGPNMAIEGVNSLFKNSTNSLEQEVS